MGAHPSRDGFQFLDSGVSLEVIAAPADERDVAHNVAKSGHKAINRRGSVILLPVAFVSVIKWFATTSAVGRSQNPIHDVRLRENCGIERESAFPRAVPHTQSEHGGAMAQWGKALALFVSLLLPCPSFWRFRCKVSRMTHSPTLRGGSPRIEIDAHAGATRCGDSALGLRGLEVFQTRREVLPTLTASHRPIVVQWLFYPHRRTLSVHSIIYQNTTRLGKQVSVWGDEVNSSVEVPA
jgi:hypothetical protein